MTKEELRNLKDDVNDLQRDMRNLVKALNKDGDNKISDTTDRLKQTANDLENRIKERIAQTYGDMRTTVQEKGQQAVNAGRQQVEERPFISMAAAFLTGFFISRLVEKK